jgi:hypothetical protein
VGCSESIIEVRRTERFARWRDELRDLHGRARIQARIERLAMGNRRPAAIVVAATSRRVRVSVSGALKLTALLPFIGFFLALGASIAGLISSDHVVLGAVTGLVLGLIAVWAIRCPRCRQLAMITKYGTSPWNRQCERCGLDLSKVQLFGRVPDGPDVALDGREVGSMVGKTLTSISAGGVVFVLTAIAAVLLVVTLPARQASVGQVAFATVIGGNILVLVAWRMIRR